MIIVNGKQYTKEELLALRGIIEKAVNSLDEDDAKTCTVLFSAWKPNKAYVGGEYVTYGVNAVGNPQLYRVIDGKDHTSQTGWTPDVTASLYTPIGLDGEGYPIWSAPTGQHDAYNTGDIVNHEGVLYESTIDGNVWNPIEYPQGWKTVD